MNTKKLVATLYKDEQGQPIHLTDGQDYIFQQILAKHHPRYHIMCHTRYGKSMTVALAVLTRVTNYPEKWAIIAGQKEKAKIIMDHIISHIFDNEFTKTRFMPDKGETVDDIRRYKNKNHLTFIVGKTPEGKQLLSEVFIGSAKDALGFGASNVVEDEAALISDDDHSFVLRMLGDNPTENFLVKIGNPFTRNHFLASYHDPAYTKIVLDCYTSLTDGRMSQATIDENRQYNFFNVLYECRFPSSSAVDEAGWQYLLNEGEITLAQNRMVEAQGVPRLGVDVAKGGRNYNAWVLRGDNYARLLLRNHEEDTVKIANTTVNLMNEHGVPPKAVFVDDTGVGHGVASVLKNRSLPVNAVNFGEAAEENGERAIVTSNYANMRAIAYAGPSGVQAFIKGGARLEPDQGWMELTRIPYKKNNSGRTAIMPKDDMRKRGIESPDIADALALTFSKPKLIGVTYTSSPFVSSAPLITPVLPTNRPFGGADWEMD